MASFMSLPASWRKSSDRLTSHRSDESANSQPLPSIRPFFDGWSTLQNAQKPRTRSLQYQRKEKSNHHQQSKQQQPKQQEQPPLHRLYTLHSPQAPKPFLTVALLRLSEVLPEFNSLLTIPTHARASKACGLLDASVATAGSPAPSPAASPKTSRFLYNLQNNKAMIDTSSGTKDANHVASVEESNKNNKTRPFVAPKLPVGNGSWLSSSPPSPKLLSWLKRNSTDSSNNGTNLDTSTSTNSIANASGGLTPAPPALALESEWERCIVPLLALAAAEVLYFDCYHLQYNHQIKNQQHHNHGPTANEHQQTKPKDHTQSTTAHYQEQKGQPPQIQPQHANAAALSSLYLRVSHDLDILHQQLCLPLLSSNITLPSQAHEEQTDAAECVSQMLQDWIIMCTRRIQLIQIQQILWWGSSVLPPTTNNNDRNNATIYSEASASVSPSLVATSSDVSTSPLDRFQYKRHRQHNNNNNSAPLAQSQPNFYAESALQLMEQLSNEVKDLGLDDDRNMTLCKQVILNIQEWQYILETATALEQCRFLPTILSLRKWKSRLKERAELSLSLRTRMDRYFHVIFKHLLSLLPVYFDRISSIAGHLYSIDLENKFAGKYSTYPDWNVVVDELLRKQSKLNGPATAVAIVLDAQSTNNIHFERGIQIEPIPNKNVTDLRLLWPAIYMRSTMHLSPTNWSQKSISSGSGILRMSTNNQPSSSVNSLHNIISTEKITPRQKEMQRVQKLHALEYGPEYGVATTFPHNEWSTLVSLISQNLSVATSDAIPSPTHDMEVVSPVREKSSNLVSTTDQVVVVTYKDQGTKDHQDSYTPVDEAVSLFSAVVDPASESTNTANEANSPKSAFHVTALSNYLSMVVIVKGEEESRWHRRRARLSDEEIRSFLNLLAGKLRVSSVFSTTALPEASPCLIRLESNITKWSDSNVEDLVKHLKESFGLRPMTPSQHQSDGFGPFSFRGKYSPQSAANVHSRKLSNYAKSTVNKSIVLEKSAAALFLGNELAAILEQNEY